MGEPIEMPFGGQTCGSKIGIRDFTAVSPGIESGEVQRWTQLQKCACCGDHGDASLSQIILDTCLFCNCE